MIDRPSGGERAILVHIDFPVGKMSADLNEFQELVRSAGANIAATITGTRRVPDSKYFVGTGKAEEIHATVVATNAELVLFNHDLSPAQERNLERLLKCRVLDRTGLILDIFAQRARSHEGKLQVELALLKHLSTRLVRGWTHLERQRGGIGLRGPGETQLETDRRLIRNRIKMITSRLAKIRKQREQGRKARKKATVPTVALVGYTNAGKSTLFNQLTNAEVFVANQLFATLDPTLRRVDVPDMGLVILADTVGFVRHLPHDLVEAFHATLEEVSEADLLLHVIDASDEQKQAYIEQVNNVLQSIGAQNVRQLLVYNKIDLVPELDVKAVHDEQGEVSRVYVSAATGLGLDGLRHAMASILGKDVVTRQIVLAARQAKLRAALYELDAVLEEEIDEAGRFLLVVRLPRMELERLFR